MYLLSERTPLQGAVAFDVRRSRPRTFFPSDPSRTSSPSTESQGRGSTYTLTLEWRLGKGVLRGWGVTVKFRSRLPGPNLWDGDPPFGARRREKEETRLPR